MTQRINWIDWAKVFAIYLVILGHHISKDVEGESLVKNFIYAFHMPFFFFISGYLFKEPKSILHLLKKGIKGLIIPYITLNILVNILLLPSFIVSKHIPLDNIFYFLTGQAVGDAGPTWFLVYLFEVWIISFLILKINIKYQFFCVLISIIIAYTFPYHLWWGICLLCGNTFLPFRVLYEGKIDSKHIHLQKDVSFYSVWRVNLLYFYTDRICRNLSTRVRQVPISLLYLSSLRNSTPIFPLSAF